MLRQPAAERVVQLVDTGLGPHGTSLERLDEVGRVLGDLAEELAFVHVRRLYRAGRYIPPPWPTESYSFPATGRGPS